MRAVSKNCLIDEYSEIMDAYIQEILNEYNASRETSILIGTLYTHIKSQLHNYDIDTLARHIYSTRLTAIARFPHLKNRLGNSADL
jgi:cytochrome c553